MYENRINEDSYLIRDIARIAFPNSDGRQIPIADRGARRMVACGVTGKGTCGGYGDAPVTVARKVVVAAAAEKKAAAGWRWLVVGVAGVFGICLLDAGDRWGVQLCWSSGVRLCSSSRKRHRDGDHCELAGEDRPRHVKSEVALKRDEPR
ncbi:hypothetical protein NL676_039195 [Syzygium grande]|nr:hypothetical protein NL676_039195 [Syzygium grande]